MTDDGKIKYSDLFQSDDSINKLIQQLERLISTYESMLESVRTGANKMSQSLKQASGATSEGRAAIEETAAATKRLKKAQEEFESSLTGTGNAVTELKAKTTEGARATVELAQRTRGLADSYSNLSAKLKDNVKTWKSLSSEERANEAVGGKLLDSILDLKRQVSALDGLLKPLTDTYDLQKKAMDNLVVAAMKHASIQGAEGQAILNTIRETERLTESYRQRLDVETQLARTQARKEQLYTEEFEQMVRLESELKQETELRRLDILIKEEEKKLTGQLTPSYNLLSLQYRKNKIELNAMSIEERTATERGKALEKETLELYKRMVALQEATGNHKLSVGNYTKAWDGLGFSISQVVRELPNAAMGASTLFLALSNNIPIVIDEIKKLKEANAAAIAAGKPAKSVVGAITSSLLSWHTALIVGITILTNYGDEIWAWAKELIVGKEAVMSLAKAQKNIAKELETTNDSYGDNVTTVKKLQQEWKNLKTTAEKNQWIKDNASEFNQLDINITNVNDAEIAFVDFTNTVIKALQLRAKAAAAMKLASEKYEESLVKRNEAELKGVKYDEEDRPYIEGISSREDLVESLKKDKKTGEVLLSLAWSKITGDPYEGPGAKAIQSLQSLEIAKESEDLKKEADQYFNIAADFAEKAKAELKAAGLGEAHKKGSKGSTSITDLSDKIAKDNLKARKKYEASTTRLIEDELEQRKAKAADSRRAESRELMLQLANNERLLKANETAKNGIFEMGGKKYKQLTEDQVNVVKEQQELIRGTILKNNEFIRKEDEKFALEEQKRALEISQETIDLRLEAVKKGSAEELNLRLQAIETEREQALIANKLLPEDQRQDESVINASFDTKSQRLLGDAWLERFEQNQASKKAEFDMRKHVSEDITAFELQQEKELWEYKIALAEAGLLDWSQEQIDAAKQAVDGINKELDEIKGVKGVIGSIAKRGIGGTLLAKMGFDDEGIQAFNDATNTIIGNLQQIMQAEVQLAEAAVEAAQERADSAKSALDAEIEARNNGYANNVASARKEYELEKKRVADNQKLLQQAKRRQEALDTAMQTASLITATANIWKSMSGVAFIGPALAIAAIASMWASFAAAKVKARQVTASEQKYGEGGLEFLEGGSHASGNDISLGTKNSRGKNMRAEGGEALAIINKRNTRRYRKQLPGIIESLNKGTFEDKYLRAFDTGSQLSLRVEPNRVDLSKIEGYVEKISNRETTQRVALPDGTTLVVRKNVRRIVKSC